MNHDHHHRRILSRRDMLHLLGGAGVSLLARPSMAQSGRATPSCVATPEQIEGPYFVDERLNRSDIRSDPADASEQSIREGAPLLLRLIISAIGRQGCEPVAGAMVDIWHCDAQGVYSDARDRHFSTVGKKFLRGYQLTGQDGNVRFTTIYPGWYPGRAVHIHFKVRTGPAASRSSLHEFTSQLYFDDSVTDRVHARMPYAQRSGRRVRNEGDGLFRDGGERLLLHPVENTRGYSAGFHVGLLMT